MPLLAPPRGAVWSPGRLAKRAARTPEYDERARSKPSAEAVEAVDNARSSIKEEALPAAWCLITHLKTRGTPTQIAGSFAEKIIQLGGYPLLICTCPPWFFAGVVIAGTEPLNVPASDGPRGIPATKVRRAVPGAAWRRYGHDSCGKNMHVRTTEHCPSGCNAPVWPQRMKLPQPSVHMLLKPHKRTVTFSFACRGTDHFPAPPPPNVSLLSALFALLPGQYDSLSRTAGSLQGGTNKSVSIAAGARADYGSGAWFLVRARHGGRFKESSRPGQPP